mgnify:CR=1 FL=1
MFSTLTGTYGSWAGAYEAYPDMPRISDTVPTPPQTDPLHSLLHPCCRHTTPTPRQQVRFGVLNAGCFGVSQSRKRTFIWAALPGELLPDWPAALHRFKQEQLGVRMRGVGGDGERVAHAVCCWRGPRLLLTRRVAVPQYGIPHMHVAPALRCA